MAGAWAGLVKASSQHCCLTLGRMHCGQMPHRSALSLAALSPPCLGLGAMGAEFVASAVARVELVAACGPGPEVADRVVRPAAGGWSAALGMGAEHAVSVARAGAEAEAAAEVEARPGAGVELGLAAASECDSDDVASSAVAGRAGGEADSWGADGAEAASDSDTTARGPRKLLCWLALRAPVGMEQLSKPVASAYCLCSPARSFCRTGAAGRLLGSGSQQLLRTSCTALSVATALVWASAWHARQLKSVCADLLVCMNTSSSA